jgi:hypothetical protein
MQTLSSSFGDILPADLAQMQHHATALTECIRFPSSGKVSQCEELIDHVKTIGCAYVCFGMPDMIRVGVIKKMYLPPSPSVRDYVRKLFCPRVCFVENDCLPVALHASEDENAPTHLPLLFVDFVLVRNLRTEICPNVVIETQFKRNKLQNMTLHMED